MQTKKKKGVDLMVETKMPEMVGLDMSLMGDAKCHVIKPIKINVVEGDRGFDNFEFRFWGGLKLTWLQFKLKVLLAYKQFYTWYRMTFYRNTASFVVQNEYEWLFDYKKGKFVRVKME